MRTLCELTFKVRTLSSFWYSCPQKCEPFANFHRNCEPLAASGEHLPKSANPLQNVRKSSNPLRMSAKSANPFEVSTSMCPKVRTLCESPPKLRTLPNSSKSARSCCKPRTLSPKFAPKGRHHTIDQKRSFSQLHLYKDNKKKYNFNFVFLVRRRQCPKNANPFEVSASNAQKCEPFANCR